MRKEIFLAVALAAFCIAPEALPQSAPVATAETKEAQSHETHISRVVVFPQGAQVVRAAHVKVHTGEQEVVLVGVPRRGGNLSAETKIAGARVAGIASSLDYEERNMDGAEDALEKFLAKRNEVNKLESDKRTLEAYRTQLLEIPSPPAPLATDVQSEAPSPQGLGHSPTHFVCGRYPVADGEWAAEEKKPSFDAEAFASAVKFREQENRKILEEIATLDEKIAQAKIELAVAKSECDKYANRSRKASQTVRVKIVADKDGEGELELSYDVRDASWRPSYDLLVDGSSATLVSYGVVSQRSGEDWEHVPVELSTAYPDASADLPEFRKILVTERFPRRNEPMPLDSARANRNAQPARRVMATRAAGSQQGTEEKKLMSDDEGTNNLVLADGTSVKNVRNVRYQAGSYVFESDGVSQRIEGTKVLALTKKLAESGGGDIALARLLDPSRDLHGIDFRYELARRETIESTGTPRRYLLSSEKFEGDLFFRIVPSENDHAYQMLSVANGNSLPSLGGGSGRGNRPILAGPANIFYGDDFVGDMDLPFTATKGVVEIPLGIDPRIAVERQRLNSVETVGAFTSSRRNSVSVSVKIANRSPREIRVVCDEPIPVSTQNEIEVSAPEFTPKVAEFDAKTGIAQWSEKVPPSGEIELKVKYEIDYPKDFAIEESSAPKPVAR